MPLLAAWIGNLFGSLAVWFGGWFARKYAIRLAIITVFITLTSGMISAVIILANGITAITPPIIGIAASWVVPNNMSACIAAIITAKLLAWVYSWQVKILEFKLT